MKKKVLILNTGGTLSCKKTPQGYDPVPGYVASVLSETPSLRHADMPDIEIREYAPLLDSSNMTIADWNRIGRDIANQMDAYDGFVVFHGTDTLAYTASALSFMLENLPKPVIVTGSQIPLSEARNDAIGNIITSLWLAAHSPLREVCVYFNQHLLRGNRTRKTSAQGFDAFASPNYPDLATIGTDITLRNALLLPQPDKPFHLQELAPHFIANFRLFPGFTTDVLEFILHQPVRALILETYGAGNAPNLDPQFRSLLQDASARGIILVNSTQCLEGHVAMTQYATGFALLEAGLVSGHDMTPEATHCKLLYLLSKNTDVATTRAQMEDNLRGELGTV